MNNKESSDGQRDIGPLLRAAANYLTSIGRKPSEEQIAELRRRMQQLSPDVEGILSGRLATYALLDGQTGRDLRQAAETSSTLIGEQLRQQQQHVREALALLVQPNEDPAAALAILGTNAPAQTDIDPELLYQQTLYPGDPQAEAGKILGKPDADKWIKLVPLAFKDANIVALLDGLGFVPEQLYATKKFAETVAFQDLARCQDLLRDHPRGGHARAQLLKHLFLSGIDQQAGGNVTLDTNGLWVNLERRNKGTAHRLHAHIPYPYASLELLEAMQKQKRLSAGDVTEAQLRRAEADNDIEAIALFEEQQARQVMESAWRALQAQKGPLIEREIFSLGPVYEHLQTLRVPELYDELLRSRLSQRASEHADGSFSYALMPVGLIRHYLRQPPTENETKDPLLAARSRAEQLLQDAAKLQPAKPKPHGTGAYDAARVVGILLDHEPSLEHLVRVSTNGGKNDFLAAASDPAVRVAINPEKGLSKPQREIFMRLPLAD